MISMILTSSVIMTKYRASTYMLKDDNRNTRARFEICPKLTIKTPEQRHGRRSGLFIVNLNIFHTFF